MHPPSATPYPIEMAMNPVLLTLRRAVAVLALSSIAASAPASTVILDNYTRTGTTDSIVAPFVSPSTATTNTYSGFVEVLVSGTGWSLFNLLNDAFHGVPGGAPYDPQYYQLNIGWSTAPVVPFSGEARNINNFMAFVEGIGAVGAGYTPAYDASHTYHFVVNTGLVTASQLQFGVSDGNFGDNGGQYNISVWQLREGAANVPESPAPYGVIGLAVVLFLAAWRHGQPERVPLRIRRRID